MVLDQHRQQQRARGDLGERRRDPVGAAGDDHEPATVETGGEVQVPAFIKEGDRLKIDTEAGTYIERVRE